MSLVKSAMVHTDHETEWLYRMTRGLFDGVSLSGRQESMLANYKSELKQALSAIVMTLDAAVELGLQHGVQPSEFESPGVTATLWRAMHSGCIPLTAWHSICEPCTVTASLLRAGTALHT